MCHREATMQPTRTAQVFGPSHVTGRNAIDPRECGVPLSGVKPVNPLGYNLRP